MEIELKITVPDELVHFIIKEFELANDEKVLSSPKRDKLKEKLVEDITNRLKMKISKDLQRKIKNLFLNAKP
jgi:hypothetical protein